MEKWLENAKLDAWYKLVALTGALAVVAAISAGAAAGILIGLGLLGIGCGEWTSRITERRPTPGGYGIPVGTAKITTRVWRPQGIALDVCGAVLLFAGLYLLLRP